MSILGRLIIITQDTEGNAAVGSSVSIYKQGAQIHGSQAGPAYTVDSPGGLVVGDTVFAASNPSTTTQVTVVTATVVTLSASLGTLADDDRLICTSNMPTLYEDAMGADSMSNPLTTDASGIAACWIMGGYYDADYSGGTPSLTRAFQYDIYVGAESTLSNQFSGTVLKSDTLRTLAATDILLDLSNLGTNKFKVMGDGEIVAGAAGATHALTGNTSITGTLTASSTITASAGGVVATAGGVTATTGNVEATAATGYLRGGRVRIDKGTALAAGDWAIDANWGATATKFAAGSYGTDGAGFFNVTANGAGLAANATCTLTFKDAAWASVVGIGVRGETGAPTTGQWMFQSGTPTQAIWSFSGLPVAGTTYTLVYLHFGAA